MRTSNKQQVLFQRKLISLYEMAIKNKCYDCMCHYDDGKYDCEVPDCSLYEFMPYRGKKAITKEGE